MNNEKKFTPLKSRYKENVKPRELSQFSISQQTHQSGRSSDKVHSGKNQAEFAVLSRLQKSLTAVQARSQCLLAQIIIKEAELVQTKADVDKRVNTGKRLQEQLQQILKSKAQSQARKDQERRQQQLAKQQLQAQILEYRRELQALRQSKEFQEGGLESLVRTRLQQEKIYKAITQQTQALIADNSSRKKALGEL